MINTENNKKSFKKGYEKIARRRNDARAEYWQFMNDLKEALGVTTLQATYLYINGEVELRISQVDAVQSVFRKYGVVGDIFGD